MGRLLIVLFIFCLSFLFFLFLQTQGTLEVTTLKLLEILDSAGIETSFWEAYFLLKEIPSFCVIDTDKSPSKLAVNVIQLNQYILEIERMIQAESKPAGGGIV